MQFQVQQPTLNQDTNRKIQLIRKSIFSDILKYNQQSTITKNQQKKYQHDRQMQQVSRVIQQQFDSIRKQDQNYRINKYNIRQMLRDQYQKEIKQKYDRKVKQKQADKVYAKIERQYMDFKNQRRIYDMGRMYNRRAFKASIEQHDTMNNKYKYSNDYNNYRNNDGNNKRIKTEIGGLNLDNSNPELQSYDPIYHERTEQKQGQRQRFNSVNFTPNIHLKNQLNGVRNMDNYSSFNHQNRVNDTDKLDSGRSDKKNINNGANGSGLLYGNNGNGIKYMNQDRQGQSNQRRGSIQGSNNNGKNYDGY